MRIEPPDWRTLWAVWVRIGCLSFGGPAAQIALMHRVIVEERKWLTERQYLDALSFCMVLPGPEAMQLATYAGWRQRGWRGGLLAGLLFVLPGAAVIMALSVIYLLYGDAPALQAAFRGIQAAVLVIVIEALLRVAKRSLKGWLPWAVATLAFVALFFLSSPFPLVIAAAAVLGLMTSDDRAETLPATPIVGQTLRTVALWAAIWLVPLMGLLLLPGADTFAQLGVFFSQLAVVTFGGAYAVLAYMAQDVVTAKGWLTAAEMADGLGLAETTPGPLILVTQFVGFLAAARAEGGGIWAGVGGALVTLWATFAPCFLWVFAGAPYIDRIASIPRLRRALELISAAVVGVILNLSLWFALHVIFADVTQVRLGLLTLWQPDLTTLDAIALGIAVLAAVLLLVLRRGVLLTLTLCAGAGLALG